MFKIFKRQSKAVRTRFPADEIKGVSTLRTEKVEREQAQLDYVTSKSAAEYWEYEKRKATKKRSQTPSDVPTKKLMTLGYVDTETALRAWHAAKLEHGCTGVVEEPVKKAAMAHAA